MQIVRNKVRSHALQTNPSVPLLLLLLDELQTIAKRSGHKDQGMYEELARNAQFHEKQIDVAAFILQVLGGKHNDIISKALEKAGKSSTTKTENTATVTQQTVPPPPMQGYYSGYMGGANLFPAQYGSYGHSPYPYNGFQGYSRGGRGYRGGRSSARGACHYCGMHGHYFRDCIKMKDANSKIKQE